MRRRRRPLLLIGAVVVLASCTRSAGGGEPAPDPVAFCGRLEAAVELTFAFDRLDLGRLEELVPELEAAVAVAPVAVADEVEVVATYAADVLAAWLAAEPLDPVEARQVFVEFADRRAAVEAAGVALEEYASTTCQLDLRNPPTTTTSVPPTSPADAGAPTTVPVTEPDPATTTPPAIGAAPSTTTSASAPPGSSP